MVAAGVREPVGGAVGASVWPRRPAVFREVPLLRLRLLLPLLRRPLFQAGGKGSRLVDSKVWNRHQGTEIICLRFRSSSCSSDNSSNSSSSFSSDNNGNSRRA